MAAVEAVVGFSWDRISELGRAWEMSWPASLAFPSKTPDLWTQVLRHRTTCSIDGQMYRHWMAALSAKSLYWAEMNFQVTSPHWSAFCFPGNDRINEIIISHISHSIQIVVYLYSTLGFSCPSFSDLSQSILLAISPLHLLPLACSLALFRPNWIVSSSAPGEVLGWHLVFSGSCITQLIHSHPWSLWIWAIVELKWEESIAQMGLRIL